MQNNYTNRHEHNGTDQGTNNEQQSMFRPLPLYTDGGNLVDSDDTSAIDDTESVENASDSLSLTPSVRTYIHEQRGNSCELCGTSGDESDLHIHHRTPKSKGGTNHPENLMLLCKECHRRHHGNEPIEQMQTEDMDSQEQTNSVGKVQDELNEVTEEDDRNSNESCESTQSSTGVSTKEEPEPLPPQSEPNGADKEILSVIEQQGPISTGNIAAQIDYTSQYVRRQCWKLAGEQLIAPRTDDTWDLEERIDTDQLQIGLPERPKAAARAGRDEIIRKMSAHGIRHTEIIEITDLSRSTVDIAVNRARALRLNLDDSDDVDFATIATRLSALVELMDHAQIE